MKIPTLSLRPNPRKIKKRRRRAAPKRVKRARAKRLRHGGGYVVELMLGDSYGMRPFAYLGKDGRAVRELLKAKRFSTEKEATRYGRTHSRKLGANWDGLRVIKA